MNRLTIRYLASGGVITSYHCVSRCGHCLYNCGPHREKEYLQAAMAERIFARIADLGCRAVHIGGGEPLLAPNKLTQVLYAARCAGVAVDYIETNTAWFVDPDQADDLLDRLREAGTHTLLISISPFHNAHIPFARVKGAIEACRRRGIRVFPWVFGFAGDLERLDIRKTHSMAEFEAVFGAGYLQRLPEEKH